MRMQAELLRLPCALKHLPQMQLIRLPQLKSDSETVSAIPANVSILFVCSYHQSDLRALRALHEPLP